MEIAPEKTIRMHIGAKDEHIILKAGDIGIRRVPMTKYFGTISGDNGKHDLVVKYNLKRKRKRK